MKTAGRFTPGCRVRETLNNSAQPRVHPAPRERKGQVQLRGTGAHPSRVQGGSTYRRFRFRPGRLQLPTQGGGCSANLSHGGRVPQGSAFPYSQAANGRDERVAPVSPVTPPGISNYPGWRFLAVFGGKWRRMAPGLGARRGAPDRSPASALPWSEWRPGEAQDVKEPRAALSRSRRLDGPTDAAGEVSEPSPAHPSESAGQARA